MRDPLRSQPNRTYWAIVGSGVIGTLIILLHTYRFGVGLDPDSVAYISAARNLLNANGLTLYDGRPYLLFPPLFPVLLSLVGVFGFDPADIAKYLNAILFGLIVFVSGLWLRNHISSRVLLALGIAVLLISTPLISVAARAWTEALFIFLAIMAIMEAAKSQKNGANRNLLISGTFAGLSFLTRFVGITVIGTCVLLILLNRDASPQRRIAKVSIYSITSAAPTFIWISRNFLISIGLPLCLPAAMVPP